MSQAPISFEGYKVNKINYMNSSNQEIVDELSIDGRIGYDDNKTKGTVVMEVLFKNQEANISLNIEMQAFFTIHIDDEDEVKKLLSQNGSAMLYPYVRTVISIITSFDNPKSVVLPSLNFSDMMNNLQQM